MKNSSSTGKKKKKRIILAPNAFKGSLKATAFCRILTQELENPFWEIRSFPLCDGGDGTASVLAHYLQATPVKMDTYDALGRPRQATYYTCHDTALVDLAGVCGLKDLVPEEYDVMNATTFSLGMVLNKIVSSGIRKILLGVGGSASIDGGCGALKAMGLQIVKHKEFYHNDLIDIKEVNTVKLKQNFKDIEFTVLCDVENPLCGPQGAATVFGPQKGASSLQVTLLDRQLQQWAKRLSKEVDYDLTTLPHGGAAGGIAASFAALLNARLVSGADYCLRLSGLTEELSSCQLVITGEGKVDAQTLYGKLPGVIAEHCCKQHIPVVAIAGIAEQLPVFTRTYALIDYAENFSASLRHPGRYLRLVARDIKKNILKL